MNQHGAARKEICRALAGLDVDSDGRLLALAEDELQRFRQAVDAWVEEDPELRELAEDDRLHQLTAAASEGKGDLALAAAQCALVHDRRIAEPDPRSRYVRVVLRWQLGHALFLMADHDEDNLRRCLRLARGSLRQAESLWRAEGISIDAFQSLIFELQSWIGMRSEALRDYEAAVEAYSAAAIAARTADDDVAYTARMASAIAKLGKTQKAYELLLLAEDRLGEVQDELSRHLWESCYSSLRNELGGQGSSARRFDLGFLSAVSRSLEESLQRGVAIAVRDGDSVPALVEAYRRELERVPEDDVLTRHALSTQLAMLLVGLRQRAEAATFLRAAESLEGSFPDEAPKLRRRIVLARSRAQAKSARASAGFAELLPQVEWLLDDGEKLDFLADSIACIMTTESEPDDAQIFALAERGQALFERLLDAQVGAPGRRSVREIHQRFFEAALFALAHTAQRLDMRSARGQELLAAAWSLVMAARNPELRAARKAPDPAELRILREKEDAFHGALRDRLVVGDGAGDEWRDRLDKVFEHELAVLRTPRVSGAPAPPPPAPAGIALAFFQLRDLSTVRGLIVLGRHDDGEFRAHAVPEAVLGQRGGEEAAAAALSAPSRDILGRNTPAEAWKMAAYINQLLPPDFELLTAREFVFPRQEGKVGPPLVPRPWFLFPDGELTSLPWEMLADWPREGLPFGRGRAVSLCLRPAVAPSVDRPVELARGWLGLGGVPAAGRFSALDGSLEEVRGLQAFLHGCGHRAELLIGLDATASRLRVKLAALRPAVVHVAAHGYADGEHPDACALVLADDPGRPERELLPFRRIGDLDLRRVDLVVLSACETLLGRSGRAAGMEGLAWAFLQAGAAQVIASRYKVDDRETVRFMAVLYRELQDHPVAEALGRARDRCLGELEMAPRHVAAWSVWN